MADDAQIGLTQAIAAWSASLARSDIPDDVLVRARHCLLDWTGVTIAGANEPTAAILAAELAELSELGTAGAMACTVIGTTRNLALYDAALVNGTASHALDYDDVNMTMLGHPSVALLGALLPLAEHTDRTIDDVLVAFVAGYEACCRVARAMGADPYRRGAHMTATVGTLGAAVACAHLLGLDESAIAVAVGLAATQAAGLKAMFGTMAKPLHAGKACANGLLAARLAARGYTADPNALEAPQGFFEAHAVPVRSERSLVPSGQWHLRSNLFKFHAACFQTHATIEALVRLREREHIGAHDIDRVHVRANTMHAGMCAIATPSTGLEVKFSLAHLAAMAVSGVDTANTASFTDECANDRALVSLRERVDVTFDGPDSAATPIEVCLRDGRRLETQHDPSVPEHDLDAERKSLRAKFESLATTVLGEARARTLADLIEAPGTTSVRTLLSESRRN